MKTTKVSLRIIAIFMTAILASFIPDSFHSFFGDSHCEGFHKIYGENYKVIDTIGTCREGVGVWETHGAGYHWGFRHWLWFAMGLTLFIIQIVDLIKTSDK